MHALMYHYVRPAPQGMPYFRYLHVDDFAAQLDALAGRYRLLRADQFASMVDGAPLADDTMILTFDDGLAEHCIHAAPLLEQRGLTGFFFVPTGPLRDGRPLDVHRIHNLLGRHGGDAVLAALQQRLGPHMVDPGKQRQFAAVTYRHQSNDQATLQVKRLLNYFVAERWRSELLDKAEAALGVDADWARGFYLAPGQIRALRRRGHLVGSHGVSHRVLSTLSEDEQRQEIDQSFAVLESMCGAMPLKIFCYPYGGSDTFDARTMRLLAAAGCRAAFAVEHRPIDANDMAARFALPRFDCNMFPFGQASRGAVRAGGQASG